MASYTEWEDFLPYVLNECPGCPRAVAETFIRKFAIRLCEKAYIIKKDASDIYVAEDKRYYNLNFTENLYRAVGINDCQWNGGTSMEETSEDELKDKGSNWKSITTSQRPNQYWLTVDNKLGIYPLPTADIDDDYVEAECFVAPVRTATKIDDWVFNNYAETIAYGALSELQRMPEKSWTNETLSLINGREWRQGLRNAAADSIRGKSARKGSQIKPKSFEVFGE